MINLLLSILFTSLLFAIFKYFKLYKINTLHAIVVNYFTAFALGNATAGSFYQLNQLTEQTWFYGAVLLGLLFISVFQIMAATAQKNGVSVASVAGKMSVVIPVTFGIILYNEKISIFKIAGIIIALLAVYLSSVKDKKSKNQANLLLPLLLFLGSGIIDTTLKYIEVNYVLENQVGFFSSSLFGLAASFGLLLLIVKQLALKQKIELKNLIAGIILGVPNYYSVFFLIKALQDKNFESSTMFTINNVAVVIISTLIGFLLFNEKFSKKNKIGIVLAIIGIAVVSINS
ncbi:MAG: EamA family transporter [Tenacibaculum sp.]